MEKMPLIKDRASKLFNAVVDTNAFVPQKRGFLAFFSGIKTLFKILFGWGSKIGSVVGAGFTIDNWIKRKKKESQKNESTISTSK